MRGNSKIRYARAVWMIERRLRGESADEIGKALNVTAKSVNIEIARYEERGVVDKVRDRLLATLDKHADSVYKEVLEATPEKLQNNSRGYALKLKAADSLSGGLGIFKTESVRETKNTLALVAEESAAEPVEKPVEGGYRVTFEPPPAPALPPEPPPSSLLLTSASEDTETVVAAKASDSEQS